MGLGDIVAAWILGAFVIGMVSLWTMIYWRMRRWPTTMTESYEKTPMPLFCPFDGRALTAIEFERAHDGSYPTFQPFRYTVTYLVCWRRARFWSTLSRWNHNPAHTHYAWHGPSQLVKEARYDTQTGLRL